MAYLGNCHLCEKQNVQRLPVYVEDKVKLVCSMHGASTRCAYDRISEDMERRVRIHKKKDGFSIHRMHKTYYGVNNFRSSYKGRLEYKSWETVLKEAKKFIN